MKRRRCPSPVKPPVVYAPYCAHWVPRKRRYCRMIPIKGLHYCAEHQNEENPLLVNPDDRIPCPLDPKHTVYKKKLAKHLKVCNALTTTASGPHIVKNINAGEEEEDIDDFKDLKLCNLEDEEFYGIISTVESLYTDHVEGKIIELTEKHNLLDEELSDEKLGKSKVKHLLQAAALLGIMEKEEQYQNDTAYLEFGAGKGQLAYYISQALQRLRNSQVVLIDRMSLRHKKDNKIENRELVKRIRADIADLKIEKIDDFERYRRYVAVSKHLCGMATDLALRCVTRSPEDASELTPVTDYIIIALCCHHRCEWKSFVGKKFFLRHNLAPRHFCIITKMASWAVCGTGFSRGRQNGLEAEEEVKAEDRDNTQRLSLKKREEIGFLCKRLLDYARLEYLEEHGYEVTLNYYVRKNVTLENVCLIAKKV